MLGRWEASETERCIGGAPCPGMRSKPASRQGTHWQPCMAYCVLLCEAGQLHGLTHTKSRAASCICTAARLHVVLPNTTHNACTHNAFMQSCLSCSAGGLCLYHLQRQITGLKGGWCTSRRLLAARLKAGSSRGLAAIVHAGTACFRPGRAACVRGRPGRLWGWNSPVSKQGCQ